MVNISLIYAQSSTQQFLRSFEVAAGSSVQQAIELSGVCAAFPEIDLSKNQVGIFNKVVSLATLLQNGDRVEIYRPLMFDPMNARRLRAKNQQHRAQHAPDDPQQKIP